MSRKSRRCIKKGHGEERGQRGSKTRRNSMQSDKTHPTDEPCARACVCVCRGGRRGG